MYDVSLLKNAKDEFLLCIRVPRENMPISGLVAPKHATVEASEDRLIVKRGSGFSNLETPLPIKSMLDGMLQAKLVLVGEVSENGEAAVTYTAQVATRS
jgi:hypothetical protein